jgi:hypothetical protein
MTTGEVIALIKAFGGGGGGSSGGGVLVVHASDDDTPVLDKTWQEISDAYTGGTVVICVGGYGDLGYLSSVPVYLEDVGYSVAFFGNQFFEQYIASSASGYPSFYNE